MSQVLLFDLDGTLTDPRVGIVRSIRHALDALGRSGPSDDALAAYIGPPLRRTFSVLLESADRSLIERAMSIYRDRFGVVGLFENEVYPGVPEMLGALSPSRAFVATGKLAVFARRIVEHFGLDGHFAGIYGADLEGRLDDKADLLAHLLETERVAAASAVMIGDRGSDVLAARANGIRSIGVLWGYGSREELASAGAHALCAAPGELASCLAGIAA